MKSIHTHFLNTKLAAQFKKTLSNCLNKKHFDS